MLTVKTYAQSDKQQKPVVDAAVQIEQLRKEYAKKPSIEKALKLLKQGNEDFFNQQLDTYDIDIKRLKEIARTNQAKYVFASILSCSDSRVPIELIFDQGPLDLFVTRVAGNIAGVSQLGTIEYGLAHLYTPVLVVLGHDGCGAVDATIMAAEKGGMELERNIPILIEHINPAVERIHQLYPEAHGNELLELSIEENVYQQIAQIFFLSPITRELVNNDLARVVGAVYNLKTGRVKWLPQSKVNHILKDVMNDPNKIKDLYAIPDLYSPPEYLPKPSSSLPQSKTPMSHVYVKKGKESKQFNNSSNQPFDIEANADFSISDFGTTKNGEPMATQPRLMVPRQYGYATKKPSPSAPSNLAVESITVDTILSTILPFILLVVIIFVVIAIRYAHKHHRSNSG
ncbi:carbonic anhydrase [Planctomycetota bacterium]|nr:carbonic anhydrase [Planctomycetota bacterium]